LSRSRLLLVNRELQSITAWNEISDLVNAAQCQIDSKIAYSWRM
jgi:hypothetical protein